jgi:hypothetical protein
MIVVDVAGVFEMLALISWTCVKSGKKGMVGEVKRGLVDAMV